MIPEEYVRPDLTPKEAEDLIFSDYGLKGKAEDLPSDSDQNFLIRTSGGNYVLKIANADVKISNLECENLAMQHLQESFIVPKVIKRQLDDELIGTLKIRSKTYATRLLSFVLGTVLADINPLSQTLLTAFGEVVGKLVLALASFKHPSVYRTLQWDLQNGSEVIKHYKRYIEDEKLKRNVARFHELLDKKVNPISHKLAKGIIHNDCNDHNILINFAKLGMSSKLQQDSFWNN